MRLGEMCEQIRRGEEIASTDIESFIALVARRELSNAEVEEWLRAVYHHGLSNRAKVILTKAMMESGEILRWDDCDIDTSLVVDKHSTGGVGDKMSLMLAPALAACGLYVPMLAGRGLGHTGGTIDKLESIPGFCTDISPSQMQEIVLEVGCCIAAQSDLIAPADGLLYALRDVTGTIASLPLITASIISKKVAEGITSLLLDVKCGSAAFMRSEEEAMELAQSMVDTATGLGVKTVAQVTRMSDPIGRMVGNSLEVLESVEVMQGNGPGDTVELVVLQGGQLLLMAGVVNDLKDGLKMIRASLQDGSALARFRRMCIAQGVEETIAGQLCIEPRAVLPKARVISRVRAEKDGFINGFSALPLAQVAGEIGAGRKNFGDVIIPSVGLQFDLGIGDDISRGQIWLSVHHEAPLRPEQLDKLSAAIEIGSVSKEPLERLISTLE